MIKDGKDPVIRKLVRCANKIGCLGCDHFIDERILNILSLQYKIKSTIKTEKKKVN